jgi:cell division transport system ATP-binding protein
MQENAERVPDEIVSLYRVRKTYPPNQEALAGVDFRVRRGEFIFIAGASGAGKSTLLKLLFGAELASDGQIVVCGRNLGVRRGKETAELRRRIGVIFQDYKLLQTRTVLENVAFALEVLDVKKEVRLKRAFRLLSAVGLREKVHDFPAMLSGGEQQRVSVARALMNRPELILADEPTGNLDPDMTRAVFNLLVEANGCGATVIVASHNLQLIEELNKRTVVLDKGAVVGDFANPRG